MKYSYRARDEKGARVSGEVVAGSKTGVVEMLRQQRMVPISIESQREFMSKSGLAALLGRVKTADVTNFTRQMATMITAGLPITDALSLLKAQSGAGFSLVVGAILTDVQSGVSLSEALSRHPRVFTRVYVALVRAGETAGAMETVLIRMADTLEKSREYRGKVVGALIYPAIIVVGMIGVMTMMVVVVVPKLVGLYREFQAELPLATRILIGVSDFSLAWGWLAVIVLVFGGMVGGYYIRTPDGRMRWDTLKYKIPITGRVAREAMLTELTRTLALLISAGVSVVESLDIVATATGNAMVERDVKRISRQVEKGFPVSISFSESEIFPPIVGQMMAVGEETGRMDDVLDRLSKYFEGESEQRVKGLTTAIEPIIIMVLAVGVGFLLYAVIMPIYSITNKL